MRDKPLVLLVEDTLSQATIYRAYLKDESIEIRAVATGKDAMSSISASPPDLVLLDLKLPDMGGEEILKWISAEDFPTAVIIITAHGSVDLAVDMIRLGAVDFLEKPFDANRLCTTVRNTLKHTRLKHLVDDLQLGLERTIFHKFIGNSLPMQTVYRIIDAAAPSKATVFITGESGTGKEICAEAIHKEGARSDQPFIVINCGAIPGDLMESEIFGHTKGAFTGAYSDRKGAAAMANKGTLFLDEIGEMEFDLQTKLLRFVQTGTFQRVGSSQTESVDIRFICATNKDPLAEVAAGRFREDLYYRLHVIPIHLPPLRDREQDILELAKHFLLEFTQEENKDFKNFSPEVEVILASYQWPGNVRQLQNVIRNIVVLHNHNEVLKEHLPPPIDTVLSEIEVAPRAQGNIPPVEVVEIHNSSSIKPLAEVEREIIERAIDFCKGNVPKAAALLEVSPSTIYRKKQGWETDQIEKFI
ncbi:MAG: sigma-54-dependent Fis family transcriptional regulator [Bacteroidetes bacterium]|nr:MAG: sigma-54-dependent Fis family transcriptional regulator [Bacteroidota bacterium]